MESTGGRSVRGRRRLALALFVAFVGVGATCDPGVKETLEKAVEAREANRGRILFVSDRDGNAEVYKVNADGGDPVRVTNSHQDESWPCFVALRSRVAFVRVNHIFSAYPDGSDERELVGGAGTIDALACSPDGTRIAFSRQVDGTYELFVADANGGGVKRITQDAAVDTMPTWAPSGQALAFQSERGGQVHIWVVDADGTNPRPITSGTASDRFPTWGSHDRILFWRTGGAGAASYVSVRPDGSDPQTIGVGMSGGPAAWSPDGQRFLFTSTHEGRPELFSWGPGGAQRFFTGGAAAANRHPSWTPDPYKREVVR